MNNNLQLKTYVFMDASNLFYGGEKSLGWKIDYQKLLEYLKQKYNASRVIYFGGIELHGYPFDYLIQDTVSPEEIKKYLLEIFERDKDKMSEPALVLLNRHLQRVKFYCKLNLFGYELRLKPVKRYYEEDDIVRRKANCDVDMTLSLMTEADNFDRAVVLSGDGDFLPVLKYLRQRGKEVLILSRRPRTAREIRQFAGAKFCDFTKLQSKLAMEEHP